MLPGGLLELSVVLSVLPAWSGVVLVVWSLVAGVSVDPVGTVGSVGEAVVVVGMAPTIVASMSARATSMLSILLSASLMLSSISGRK